jgi:hypothetical protein
VQEIMGASPGIWGSPAYWNGNLYWTGANDSIKAYSFNANGSGLISTAPTSVSSQIFAFSAPTPIISSNGNTNGVLWALDSSADDSTCDGGGSNCLGLYAYNATNLANLLYISTQAANNRDSPGIAVKFEKPIVANGKVYVGTQNSVTVYGLLATAPPLAATPTFLPVAGVYSAAQSVTIADATPGATIYYTTNGSTPTANSPVYSGTISVSASETLQAIAVFSGYATSAVGSAVYSIGGSTTVVNDPTGFATATGLSLVGVAALASGALELTNDGGDEASAVWYTTPVNVQAFTTDFNFQVTPASASIADGFTFTIQNVGVSAVGGNGGGLGYLGIGSSVAVKFDLYNNDGEGADSTGFYTDGAAPTVPAIDMTASGVNLHSGDILHAHISYAGTTLTLTLTDTVTNASFTTSTAINIPATVGGNTAYVGFTGGTGGATAIQEILNWTYTVN